MCRIKTIRTVTKRKIILISFVRMPESNAKQSDCERRRLETKTGDIVREKKKITKREKRVGTTAMKRNPSISN